MAGNEDRGQQAAAVRRVRLLEERAASQAVIRSGTAGRAGRRKSPGGSEVLTAIVVIVIIVGILVLVFKFAG